MSSGVDTDYWKRVNERNRLTAGTHGRLKALDGSEDRTTKKHYFNNDVGSSIPESGFNTQNDFFGPSRPVPQRLYGKPLYCNMNRTRSIRLYIR